MSNNNIDYYNLHAEEFFKTTVDVDMSAWRDKFEKYVSDGGRILDAGCGSGRDSRAFKMHGFSVVAFDASAEMCRMSSELLDQKVWQMRFDEMSFDDEFSGVWACSSLLHVPYDEMEEVFLKIKRALVDDGYFYFSFKLGDEETTKGERTFSNYTEESIVPLLEATGFETIESGISFDVRPGRGDEKWLNMIVRKRKEKLDVF